MSWEYCKTWSDEVAGYWLVTPIPNPYKRIVTFEK